MGLARRIRSILVEDERTKDFSFDVLDNNRVVTLSGIVPNEKACQKAGQVVKEQEGVIEVINDLNLEGE